MSLPGYDETLVRFGLESLKSRVDLHVSKSGDIAVTRDGDLQMGDTQINALFRLVERWRRSESTINDLFTPMLLAARQLSDLSRAREQDKGPSLLRDPKAFHDVTDAILEYQSVSSVLAGAIFVVLNKTTFFVFPQETPRVQVRVGSIHSVKGKTHTATLVLIPSFTITIWPHSNRGWLANNPEAFLKVLGTFPD